MHRYEVASATLPTPYLPVTLGLHRLLSTCGNKSVPHVCCSARQQLSLSKLQQIQHDDVHCVQPLTQSQLKSPNFIQLQSFGFLYFIVPNLQQYIVCVHPLDKLHYSIFCGASLTNVCIKQQSTNYTSAISTNYWNKPGGHVCTANDSLYFNELENMQ